MAGFSDGHWLVREQREERRVERKGAGRGRRGAFPFHKRSMPFSRHLEIFFNCERIFSTKLKKKENLHASNHLVSNPEPLFPDILLYHYTTRLIRQISPKFNYKT